MQQTPRSADYPNTTSIERRESHFKGRGGCDLFFQTWAPAEQPPSQLSIVITHGMGEHSECYNHVAGHFAALGYGVVAWDLRGHGRSEGKRGYVADFNDYVFDLNGLLSVLQDQSKLAARFILLGHSMGGLITLRHLLNSGNNSAPPVALALSSPQLGIALEVPAIKDAAARVLNWALPSVTLFNEINYADLTRDPEFLKAYPTDALRHDKISPRVYLGMLSTIEHVMQNAARIKLPTLIQAAGDERIVSLPATQALFPRLGCADKELIVYPGSLHEIFNDLDRERVFADLGKFLTAHLPPIK